MAANQDYAGPGGVTPGGHYRFGAKSGATTTIAGGGNLFAFRWTDTARFARVKRVDVGAAITTAFGTAQQLDVSLFRVTGWSVAPTAGVALTALKSTENQMADQGSTTTMAPLGSLFNPLSNNVAISNTAALTLGTSTVDGNALAYAVIPGLTNTIGSAGNVTLYDVSFGLDYPLTLGPSEGFVIQLPTTQGATGVVTYYVTVVFAANNTQF